MPDPDAVAAIRAAVDAMLPATDGRPGAVDLGVERHVVEQAEGAMVGSTDLMAALLNAYADGVRSGVAFAELSREERVMVLRTMYADEAQDIRDVVDTIQIFAIGGMYSEWTTFDPKTRELQRPATWDDVGYHGPVDGVPDYRVDI
jgi:gluconate 2-dehydrogenase subunit 3-like protein